MTQPPKVPTLLALQTVRDFGADSEYYKAASNADEEPRPVYLILAERSGRDAKQVWRALEKLIRKGWVAQGSSPRSVWLTDSGRFQLMQLEDPEKYALPPSGGGFTYAEKSWSRKHAPAVVKVSDSKLEPCSHCGNMPKLKRVWFPFFSNRMQFRCQCGVAGPTVVAYTLDLSWPWRTAVRGWNCVMLGVKVYGNRNRTTDKPFDPTE